MNNQRHHPKLPPPEKVLYWALAFVLTLGAFLAARRLTACWQLTTLPGVPPAYCALGLNELPDPNIIGQIPDAPVMNDSPEIALPHWDGASRVNIVFFGLRGGEISGEGCPACTDTIILLTVDPVTKTAGMLSIPRDLWVNIPGFGYGRINTAWTLGEGAKLPGGGPGLAMKTVSQLIGVPVHNYVQVDFGTFVSFINRIGGIDVYVEERMVLDPAGPGLDHFVLKPGDYRHLDGKRALAYARCRHESQGCSGGDVGRAKRQQQVILAVRNKVLDPETFSSLISQAPQLYQEFSSGIHTDMSLEDAMKLAVLAKDIKPQEIRQGVIDNNMAVFANVTVNGVQASVLRPVPDLIRILRDEIFVPEGPLSPLAQGDPVTLMQEDGARVRIVNNSYSTGLEKRTATFLFTQGMNTAEYGIPSGWSSQTWLVVYSPQKLYALRYLVDAFAVDGNRILFKPNAEESVDFEIRLGEDWTDRLPQGF
jgi:LCP family protein required for cell wall assembly